MNRIKLKILTYISIGIALTLIFKAIPIWRMPLGGEVSLEMLSIFLIGFLINYKYAIVTGFLASIISFLMQPIIIHPAQIILDYPLAYSLIGLGTIFYKKNNKTSIIISIIAGSLFRFLAHFISGVIFFKTYIPDSFPYHNIYIYSAFYNLSYILPEIILIILIIYPIYKKIKKFSIN